jgi:C-terminal processing protease CtpA/Prc
VDARNGWITVVAPMSGTPAERLGIRPGDQLAEVDGLSASPRRAGPSIARFRRFEDRSAAPSMSG